MDLMVSAVRNVRSQTRTAPILNTLARDNGPKLHPPGDFFESASQLTQPSCLGTVGPAKKDRELARQSQFLPMRAIRQASGAIPQRGMNAVRENSSITCGANSLLGGTTCYAGRSTPADQRRPFLIRRSALSKSGTNSESSARNCLVRRLIGACTGSTRTSRSSNVAT